MIFFKKKIAYFFQILYCKLFLQTFRQQGWFSHKSEFSPFFQSICWYLTFFQDMQTMSLLTSVCGNREQKSKKEDKAQNAYKHLIVVVLANTNRVSCRTAFAVLVPSPVAATLHEASQHPPHLSCSTLLDYLPWHIVSAHLSGSRLSYNKKHLVQCEDVDSLPALTQSAAQLTCGTLAKLTEPQTLCIHYWWKSTHRLSVTTEFSMMR